MTTPSAAPAASGGRLRVARKEEALWLLESLVPGSAPNNLSLSFQADGRLDDAVLDAALEVLLRRHEVLRTAYLLDGTELTKTRLAPDACLVRTVRGTIDAEGDLTAFVAGRFVLDGTPLLRAGVFALGSTDVFCLVAHHLVFDTLSSRTVLTELVEIYDLILRGRPLPAELTRPVAALAEARPRPESLEYWKRQLAGFDPAGLALRCGTPDVAEPTLTSGRILHTLSAEARDAVRRMQKEVRAPEAVILLAAYCLLLTAHGASPDIVVGSPMDVRPPGAAGAVGYHVNVMPLRVQVPGERGFRELARAVREVFFAAMLHADVPVDELSADLPRHGDGWRTLLFRHLFNYIPDFSLGEFTIGGLPAHPLVVENGYSKFDLELFVLSSAKEILIRAVYGTDFLAHDDVAALLARYEALLLSLGQDPDRPVGELPVWSERDHAVIDAANRTATPTHPELVLCAIRDRCQDAAAVVEPGGTLTYGRLWHAAHAVRQTLASHGVRPGDVVALVARRSGGLAAAVLGAWLAGAAYLPVDPEHPARRVAFQLADAGVRVILADDPAAVPDDPEADSGRVVLDLNRAADPGPDGMTDLTVAEPDPESVAYLIYTSGSTGTPKGTLISHRSLANLVAHFAAELRVCPSDAALWLTTFAFDISALELFVPLASGGTVVVAPDSARLDGRMLRGLLDEHRIGIVQATPTTWRQVLDHVEDGLTGRRVLCGGEPAPLPLVRRLLAAGCELHHVYGPTETTIWSTSGPVRPVPGQRLDIGRPIANTRVMVLDPSGRSLPVGVTGELCIAGEGVALGYHDRPELTAERFREDLRHGRYYRTGDEARWRVDGTVELLGRADRQVKLRGNRIELGEVEAAVLRHPEVTAVAVVVAGDPTSDAQLVAYVVAAVGAGGALADRLWEHCRQEVPRALVPQEFVSVDALPVNGSQKIDYPALVRLAGSRPSGASRTGTDGAGPEDELVTILMELWSEVLKSDDIASDTHFFANGGHSLAGALLVQRIEERTGIEIPLAELFAEPTPERLARHIRR